MGHGHWALHPRGGLLHILLGRERRLRRPLGLKWPILGLAEGFGLDWRIFNLCAWLNKLNLLRLIEILLRRCLLN
jgi:hypothetical protein